MIALLIHKSAILLLRLSMRRRIRFSIIAENNPAAAINSRPDYLHCR